MRGELYQIVLISLGVICAALFGVFLFREIYPEYREYQNDYVALEAFRSTYTGEAPPPFAKGVKQIVLESKNNGPVEIDRCTSCHVALKFQHFSPTKIDYDINGNMRLDSDGFPILIPNENYVWGKLDQAISNLRDQQTNEQLIAEGKQSEVNSRLKQADQYESLKTVTVGDQTYDVTKVLAMHPLIGRETRPFDLHPIEEYGCTSCHGGNGRGLTTPKAHGPVFDGQYHEEFMGPEPQFLEEDPKNDPTFSTVFNHKPGHELLFQTTPILVGSLIESKCVQCHNTSAGALQSAYDIANITANQRLAKFNAIKKSYTTEINSLQSLITLQRAISDKGFATTFSELRSKEKDYTLPEKELEEIAAQVKIMRRNQGNPKEFIDKINNDIVHILGSKLLAEKLIKSRVTTDEEIENFIATNKESEGATGSLFEKAEAINLEKMIIQHVQDTDQSFQKAASDRKAISAMVSDVDLLTKTYQRGKKLYISQACYACHRIAGFSRGGIGPELTEEGNKYPWFIKESMTWPQADLKTSTMPNFHLDHEELEALMTFLLAQKGQRKMESDTGHKVAIQQWEAGKLMSWEQPTSPAQMHDLDYAMEVFAVEGCAACHRLKGYTSDVGYAIEKNTDVDFETLYSEREWFQKLFPEEIAGSQIVHTIEKHKDEIDARIVDGVRENSILEKIKEKHPESIDSLYSNFRFASRAKNTELENDEEAKKVWKERVHRILMMYVQEYGLGRLIGPRPNWAGVYRTDEWLMEHFKNPSSHVARSIMPVLPFSNNKFYALTYMLDVLGVRNRDEVRQIWENKGFNPKQAYDIHCAQCHGEFLQGNGPVSEWIYPIPKSLRNADFLRNLTREKVYESIVHGVKGTPMPPWGEVGKDKPMADGIPVLSNDETEQLVDWIYSSLPGAKVIRTSEDVPKWKYTAEDVINEMKKEGTKLESDSDNKKSKSPSPELSCLKLKEDYFVDVNPKVYQNSGVQEYFDIIPHPVNKTEDGYYIKKRFYTPENLERGQYLFELNCAVCHGREADGTGDRAGAMVDAKPRMLTNLDWLDTRDDLRLLRSIKYGVQGTSMTPWGDQTSSLQRMQLVMYIRTLSSEAKKRGALLTSLYKAFNESEILIENIRIQEYPKLSKVQKELDETKENQVALHSQVKTGSAESSEALAAYQKELALILQLKKLEVIDQTLQELIEEIKNEKAIMMDLGLAVISQQNADEITQDFYRLVDLENEQFQYIDGNLGIKTLPEEKIAEIKNSMIENIDRKIESLEKQKTQEQGKIQSPEVQEKIDEIKSKTDSLQKLKIKTISSIGASVRSEQRQAELVKRFESNKQ
ncbi:MAG: c-type cytochrome [Chlamydiota bacterium]|nr:c-type cytochrome [Chlamydiota bacterium]